MQRPPFQDCLLHTFPRNSPNHREVCAWETQRTRSGRCNCREFEWRRNASGLCDLNRLATRFASRKRVVISEGEPAAVLDV